MALINCGECGKEISDQAPSCPGCGAPLHPATVSQTVYTKPATSVFTWIVTGAIALGVFSCVVSGGKDKAQAPVIGSSAAKEACINRGIAYYKEIGSYPTLKSEPNKGKSARAVATDRCTRTTTAF